VLSLPVQTSDHGDSPLYNDLEKLALPFYKGMSSGRLSNSEMYSLAINPHFHNNDKYVLRPTDGWLSHWLLPVLSITMTNNYGCAAGGLGICAVCLGFFWVVFFFFLFV